jgi:acetyl/propionyl-CoA carboxylase alpha subunit/acetyl-CoA carboxylase carboxyltransferase component
METAAGLGRVAVLDGGEGARRVLRALHELARAGQAGVAVAVHGPHERLARFVREADEAVEVDGSTEAALRAARADAAWLGPAPLDQRTAFAQACEREGVAHIGPPADALRRLSAQGGLARLAAELGIPTASPREADPRDHLVEVVVARDSRGTAHALGVGDASLRRGELAVLSESPSPALTSAGDTVARVLAVRACTTAGWVGVCAVQLLVDPRTRRWVLLGLDPFAQSAPAVEALAGIDLVRLALLLAAGAPLGRDLGAHRHDSAAHGHAFAARILARDPEAGAGPAPGPVEVLRLPSGLGVSADLAVGEGDEALGPDGVLATLVSRGASRDEAAHRLEQALVDGDVLLRASGSSKAWLLALCARPEVRAGEAAVGLLDELASSPEKLVQPQREAALLVAGIRAYHAEQDLERTRFIAEARRGRSRVGPSSGRAVELRWAGHRYRLDVRQVGPHEYRVAAGGAPAEVHLERLDRFEHRLTWEGRRYRVLSAADGLQLLVQVDGVAHLIARDPSGIVTSPMPAVVVAIPVEPGQAVAAGDPVARIESMKVEVEVRAPTAGIVREVLAAVNGQVYAGGPLVRLEPLAQEPPGPSADEPEPLSLGAGSPPATGPRARYLGALTQLRQLLLGFDVASAEARKLAGGWRELSAAAPADDPEALRREEWALSAFADLQSLYSRARRPEAGRPPPLEELWRYLHEPEARGEGLSPSFIAMLRRSLAYFGVSMDAPGSALEAALLRIQKAHDRVGEQLAPIAAILERRLASEQLPPTTEQPWRDVLDRLADLGQERFPALADLARELRYRSFDQPAFERILDETYAQAEADLARLASAPAGERQAIIRRLVECPQPLITLFGSRMVGPGTELSPLLVETLLRRYYRFRPLESVTALDLQGLPCAVCDYERDTQRFRLVACFAPAADVADSARKLARFISELPAGSELIVEFYLWDERPRAPADEVAELLRSSLAEAALPGPLRRASVVLAMPGLGLGRNSQQYFTFRQGADGLFEDRRTRDVHPMLFERLHLERLAKFDLERLPSVEDVYLYRGVAQGNPKDERLFAMAEVRDLTAVRDARGDLVQIPQLERMFQEALAGMRVFQARRPPNQRLEWNRVLLTLAPPLNLSREEISAVAERLMPATEGLGLEMMLMTARVPDPTTGELRETLLRVITRGQSLTIRWDPPADRPLEPMAEYQQKVVQLRRRGLTHPFEIVRMLTPAADAHAGVPPGDFVEYDLDASNALVPVHRPPGSNTANIVVGVIRNFTPRYPEGVTRVVLLGDPGREMGSVAEPECRRILAGLDLAKKMGVPLDWLEVCAGAKISMETGTENMDWISAVLRRLIEFTQRGGEINILVLGITVGAQPYWNAEATMLMHTKGILVMAPGSSMVLTGKQALEYSGSVSAEDNEGIGGYDRIMGPNGQAQYQAGSVAEACEILLCHYDHCYVAPGERFPRRAPTTDPRDRDVCSHPHGPEGGAGFRAVGDIFSQEHNPDRKKPFEIRHVMAAAIDQDRAPLERWRDMRGGDTGVIWDAHLGGWPVCLIGIQSRPLPRLEFVPADGPEFWSAGTLFPQSSKKIARAINSASGNRPLVVLANLSGFDGSPESMRRLQLEYGAEIGRAVVNFDGPIVFTVVSRYHGGAFVVFAKTLSESLEIAAVEGARASVIGGAPAAAVVFAREVETRTRKDARVVEAEKAATAGGTARSRLAEAIAAVRSDKLGEVGDEFDTIHSVERALKVGSLDRIIAAKDLRPYLIDALERGMAKFGAR